MGGMSLLPVTRKIWVSESRRDRGKQGARDAGQQVGLALEVRVDLETALEGNSMQAEEDHKQKQDVCSAAQTTTRRWGDERKGNLG